jgi:CHAT domain-containing protein
LKYNISEVEHLGTLFQKPILLTGAVSHDQFRQATQSVGILHLAMHAEVDQEEPMLSSFILSATDTLEDRYYAYEIQSNSMKVQHAVLSACNTGSGKVRRGEGVMSLARCFQYAGCRSLLVSLWPVDDLATRQLMSFYYTHLLDGKPKDVSLQLAKQDFIKSADPATRHPYYWAGFILIGNAEPLDFSSPPISRSLAGAILIIGLLILSGIIWWRSRHQAR